MATSITGRYGESLIADCGELMWGNEPIVTDEKFMDLVHRVDDLENTVHRLITLLLERKEP